MGMMVGTNGAGLFRSFEDVGAGPIGMNELWS